MLHFIVRAPAAARTRNFDRMKSAVILCTTVGGMAEVVRNLRETELFSAFRIRVIITHDGGGTGRRIVFFLKALTELTPLLVASKVALVHVQMAAHGSCWRKSVFVLLARLFSVPTLLHLHSEYRDFYEKECGPVRRRFIRYVLEHASTVIVLSDRLHAYLATTAPGARLVTIHNFVNLKRLSEAERVCMPRSSNTILFIGLIGRRKGVYDLVRALPEVIKAVPEARLVAAGPGEIDGVRRCARECGVDDRVLLPGWVSGFDKLRLLEEAALYVLPSYTEGVPLSMLEAMSVGLPVIATPVGGIPDVLRDGEDGYLVPPGSLGELSRRIIELLNNRRLRERMGENARRRLHSKFSADIAVPALIALYQQYAADAALPRAHTGTSSLAR
jgi:glycosyltransferase involved in cell wall biosynthesis